MSKTNIILTITILFLTILSIVTRIQVVELNRAIQKLEPLYTMECEVIIPYEMMGRYHLICWNYDLDEHSLPERRVIRRWHLERGLPQPQLSEPEDMYNKD